MNNQNRKKQKFNIGYERCQENAVKMDKQMERLQEKAQNNPAISKCWRRRLIQEIKRIKRKVADHD
jgi:hypothetical protein